MRNKLRVLVACEYSGTVRDSFIRAGHDAMSCDILPTDKEGPHYQGDVFDIINDGFDLMIAHPPCTHLSVSGARWFKDKMPQQRQAIVFFMRLALADIPRIAVENPISVMSSAWRKPDQIIQPWQYGHGETKATCLWLKNLPPLVATNIVEGRESKIHKMPPGPDRGKLRSLTYQGIADAMAQQWG